jgi:nucleoside-diphosphate-sugar epimerase
MKILVIGGTGHVGSFLVPQLLAQGHDVSIGSRNQKVIAEDSPLQGVRLLVCDSQKEADLEQLAQEHFDVVIDFPGTAAKVYQAFREKADHVIACGSLWMYGYPLQVPTPEITQAGCVFSGYATRYAEIRQMLQDSGSGRAVFTAIMPPNICGPGKIPLDALGGRDLASHRSMQAGQPVFLPDGPEALVGPCDAEDIASLFALAVNNRTAAADQIFNVGSAYALPASRFIAAYSAIYQVKIPVEKVSWARYKEEINPDIGAWWHFYAHMQPSIDKARRLLGYEPRYTPEETLARAVRWMRDEDML